MNESGDTEKWEFSGGSWAVGGFSQVGAEKFSELSLKTNHIYNVGKMRESDKDIIKTILFIRITKKDGISEKIKLLQTGYSSDKDRAIFYLVGEISGIIMFELSENERSGIKFYELDNEKVNYKIFFDWDTYNILFPDDLYRVNDTDYGTDGLYLVSYKALFLPYIKSLNDELDLQEKCNQFNGDNQIESSEKIILNCIRMYKVITLDRPYEFKLLQTGFSNSEKRVIFYMGIRNIDDTLTAVNVVPQENASSINDLSGIKRYETDVYNSVCGKLKQIVEIDWDKYKESLSNRYLPAYTDTFSGRRLSVISDIANNTSDFADKETVSNIEDNLSLCIRDVKDKDIVAFKPTTHTEYFRNGYVVYNVPFEKNGILRGITTNIYKHDYSVMQFTLLIGKIDQRNWLINPRTYSYSFSELLISEEYSGNNLTINLFDKNIKVNEGEVLCLFSRRNTDGPDGKSFLIERNDNDSDKVLFSTSLNGEFTVYKEFANLSYSVKYYDTDFADKETLSNIKNSVTALTETVNLSSIFVDLSTGKRYKIVVNDGSIQLKNIDYSKILFIGSSFVNHGISSDVGWYRNGAMAPSIGAHSLPNLVLEGLKSRNPECTLNIMSSIDWERNYNTTFDFDTMWKPTLKSFNPDVICMHISGNSTWTEEFESACEEMIDNVKKTCPLADVYIAASWHGGQKATDMRTACNNKGAVYVDLSSYKIASNMWNAGDWYYAEDDSQYHGIYAVVASHPNDMGCLQQANAYLRSAGYDEIVRVYSITLNQDGNGKASIVNNSWLNNGIVTIRIESGTVSSIKVTKSNGVTIEPLIRNNNLNESYNTYYTFTMPNENVTIDVIFVE